MDMGISHQKLVLRSIVVVGVAVIVVVVLVCVALVVAIIFVVLVGDVIAVVVLAELVLGYLISAVLVVLGDPPVVLVLAVVAVVASVLVKDSDLLVVAPVVLVLAELVLDYLVSVMLVVLGDPPVVLTAVIVLGTDADLPLIPTVARRGGIPPGGRARGIRCSRGVRAGGLIACPEGVPVTLVGRLRGCSHRYRVAFVAEGDLLLATSLLLFREGHGNQGQHGYHHRSHHAKNRHITAH